MSVYTKLNDAREKFHQLKLEKTGLNKFAGYKYFELGDFIIPALTIFKECGLCAYISFGVDVARMVIVDVGCPGRDPESIIITSPMSTAALKGCHEVQQLGAVQTYLRRYLWVAALEIVEHDALDAVTGKDVKSKSALAGIGDDLPDDWKTYLKDLATELINMVASGNIQGAKDRVAQEKADGNLDGDMAIFLDRHLDSKTRSAISTRK
jgi:hypothetical protein